MLCLQFFGPEQMMPDNIFEFSRNTISFLLTENWSITKSSLFCSSSLSEIRIVILPWWSDSASQSVNYRVTDSAVAVSRTNMVEISITINCNYIHILTRTLIRFFCNRVSIWTVNFTKLQYWLIYRYKQSRV